MSDYISRQETINAFYKSTSDGDAIERAEWVLRGVPSADVVEVVRCMDCSIHGICRFERGLGLNGFCSQGNRKEDII